VKTALYWEKFNGKVKCVLCPHNCIILDEKQGVCKVRNNADGTLVTSIYGEITSIALDPVEKKPLYHFFPGSKILSIGTNGCNLSCRFCQNWQISQNSDSGRQSISSDEVVKAALKAKSIGIAYTYNEPFIWYEFVLETAKKAKNAGLKNVLVTNGYVNEAPLMEILPFIDAMNIDLKAFKQSFYKNICNGDIKIVKQTIIKSFKKCHIELTNLLIPSQNDTEEELNAMAEWVAGVSTEIPVHLSRYFPKYQMKEDSTSVPLLENAKKILLKKLKYVYIGNVDIPGSSNTVCNMCKNLLIDRTGHSVRSIKVVNGKCEKCGNDIYGNF